MAPTPTHTKAGDEENRGRVEGLCRKSGAQSEPAVPTGSSLPSLSSRITDTVTASLRPRLSPYVCALGPWVFQPERLVITSSRKPSWNARVEWSPASYSDGSSGSALANLNCNCFCFGFPTGLATLRDMKHSSICLPGVFRASHLSLSIWSV